MHIPSLYAQVTKNKINLKKRDGYHRLEVDMVVMERLGKRKQLRAGRKPCGDGLCNPGPHPVTTHTLTVCISLMDKDAEDVFKSLLGTCFETSEKYLSILSAHLFLGSFGCWDTVFGGVVY